jgi:threonine/homoserine/homoserine lactone efflux protein
MYVDNFTAFVATATVLTMAPGLDTAMVLRSAAVDGAARGVATAVGVAIGCLCWGSAAVLGLSALLQGWPLAFAALKWGGAYLGWLGLQLLMHPRRTFAASGDAGADAQATGLDVSVRRGFATNILNPKAGLFYLTLLPQFVPHAAKGYGYALLLACTQAGIALAWFVLLATITGAIRPWLRRPGVVPALDRFTGGIFVLLGLQLVR